MLNAFSKKVQSSLLRDSHQSAAPWPAPKAVVGVVIGFIFSQTLGSVLLLAYPQLLGWSQSRTDAWLDNSTGAQFIYVLITESLTLLVLWLFWRGYKRAEVRAALGLHRKPHWKDMGYAFMGVVVYLMLYAVFFSVINSLIPVDTTQEQAVGFDHAKGGALVLAFISLVILPPIVEEITFRGFLFSGLKRRFGAVTGAIFTSLLFAAPHLLTGKKSLLWVAAIDTFVLSLVLCYLREKTGSLYASIIVHALKNSIAFMALFIFASS